MAYETDSEQRRSVGPALASALIGALLGGAAIFGIGQALTEDRIPEAQAVSADDALLGGVEYGQR
ncbi:DUF2613 domain-containing protein [Corynebacterium sp. MSK032]|uniref:DUF2613 domain-containing protein n=1 Tax=unclassified Corynebacterium TaxID=2624378 RepID=UPI0008A4687A|nr:MULTISPECIES: DUF2613 domain-containing protein [unclassified Corynebacterium]MDK8793113.1 DUF2613 domain-containing protein [Corynebacterium sp. MSK032]OFR59044.1 hypothetical protein HMPREF2878_01505 [Corynebacterium sp. HMSC065H09]